MERMRKASAISSGASAALLVGALFGCASQGARYSEVVTQAGPVSSGQTRIVLLRPGERFDNYSLSRAVIRVNDRKIGGLAYKGFLLFDVPGDEVVVQASARNRFYGSCELQIQAAPGGTVYIDVAPRPANVAADVVGAAVGTAVVGSAATHAGMDAILVDESAAQAAAAGAAGGAAASAVEGADKECGGPFSLRPVDEAAALKLLDSLSSSE